MARPNSINGRRFRILNWLAMSVFSILGTLGVIGLFVWITTMPPDSPFCEIPVWEAQYIDGGFVENEATTCVKGDEPIMVQSTALFQNATDPTRYVPLGVFTVERQAGEVTFSAQVSLPPQVLEGGSWRMVGSACLLKNGGLTEICQSYQTSVFTVP